MSNRTYICTACRTARRAEAWYGVPSPMRCALCRGALWELSQKWRIPAKTNDKGWRDLERLVAELTPRRVDELKRRGTVLLRHLDDKMSKLEKQNRNGHRDEWIADLKKEREEIQANYFDGATSPPRPA